LEQIRKGITQHFNDIYDSAKKGVERYEVQELSAIDPEEMQGPSPDTAVDRVTVERIIEGITTFPAGFQVHPKLEGFLRSGARFCAARPGLATAETLAFGSLVLERTPVRLSGQDSGRGTFSQRHLELYDNETGARYIPLKHLAPNQAASMCSTALKRYAVMGFEFGLQRGRSAHAGLVGSAIRRLRQRRSDPDRSVYCERGIEMGQPSGLVLLLPHGYEGKVPNIPAPAGAVLQLCAENNMQVVNASTPRSTSISSGARCTAAMIGEAFESRLSSFTPSDCCVIPRPSPRWMNC